jgi:hypothetical protein
MPGAALVFFFQSAFHLTLFDRAGSFVSQFDIRKLFEVVSALGFALTAFRLYHAGLHRRYRVFFAYLIFQVPYVVCALLLDVTGKGYLDFFIWSEPVIMIFYVLLVLELYRLVLERYQGLYTLGRWAMGVAMVIAVAVSIISFWVARALVQAQNSAIAGFELKAEARLDLALVLFILLIIWFLGRYPIPLNRNVVVHTVVYSVFFFANSLGLVFWLLRIKIVDSVNTTLMGIASACAIAWWIGLTPQGEEVQAHLPSLGSGAEQRVLLQLEALNATLLRASRK